MTNWAWANAALARRSLPSAPSEFGITPTVVVEVVEVVVEVVVGASETGTDGVVVEEMVVVVASTVVEVVAATEVEVVAVEVEVAAVGVVVFATIVVEVAVTVAVTGVELVVDPGNVVAASLVLEAAVGSDAVTSGSSTAMSLLNGVSPPRSAVTGLFAGRVGTIDTALPTETRSVVVGLPRVPACCLGCEGTPTRRLGAWLGFKPHAPRTTTSAIARPAAALGRGCWRLSMP